MHSFCMIPTLLAATAVFAQGNPQDDNSYPDPYPYPQDDLSQNDYLTEPDASRAQAKCSNSNFATCASLAASDRPPNYLNQGVKSECTNLANYARQHYIPGTWNLVWDEKLAAYAKQSADYAARNDCWNCHTNSGAGTTWGQNLYLSKKSCTAAYSGWVTEEAKGNPLQAGHFKNVVGLSFAAKKIGCGSSNIG
ncbi:hypothetical protein HDU79_003993 [Rhizoclosmatium sp. JEL0117]|nr:hypothetical protein HDU79_003993 [Rhizoclosmatium sp. JEL0117]